MNGLDWWRAASSTRSIRARSPTPNGDGIGDLRGIARPARPPRRLWASTGSGCRRSSRRRWPTSATTSRTTATCDPIFGTLDDLDELIAGLPRARHPRPARLGPEPHVRPPPVVRGSRSSRDDPQRDWYVWRDGARRTAARRTTGARPSGGRLGVDARRADRPVLPALVPARAARPQLGEPEVEAAMHDVLRFWLDRGVDGFRIDVVATDRQGSAAARRRRRRAAGATRTGRRHPRRACAGIRRVVDEYPDRMLVGEVYAARPAAGPVATSTAATSCTSRTTSSSCDLPWDAEAFRASIDDFEALAGDGAWPAWFLAQPRRPARREPLRRDGQGPRARARSLLMLYALRGTPFVYQGDELGLPDAEIPAEPRRRRRRPRPRARADPVAAAVAAPGPGAGFTSRRAVAAARRRRGAPQRRDAGRRSGLDAHARPPPRRAAARSAPALQAGAQRSLDCADAVFAWLRERAGERHAGRGQPRRRAGAARRRRGPRRRRARPVTDRRAAAGGSIRPRCGSRPARGCCCVSRARRAALGGGLAVRLDAAGRGGRPGPLPRAVRARLADHLAAGAAASARRVARRRCARSRGCRGARSTRARSRSRARSATSSATRRRRSSSRRRLARRGPFPYYGTADADVVVPRAARRRPATRRSPGARGAWRAAGGWLDGALERGGGLVRHAPGEWGALTQQGWRDAIDPRRGPGLGGILRPDGRRPESPLADVDSQAVAHAALRALGAAVGRPAAGSGSRTGCASASARSGPTRWRSTAGDDGGARRRLPARLAAVGGRARRPAPARRRPSACAQPDVLTGFGLRTLSSDVAGVRPDAYHRGSVWPFDSWLGWGGLRAAGRDGGGRARPHRRARRARPARARARALRRHDGRRASSRSRSPTACRRGPSAPAGRWTAAVGRASPASRDLQHVPARPVRTVTSMPRFVRCSSADPAAVEPHRRRRVRRAAACARSRAAAARRCRCRRSCGSGGRRVTALDQVERAVAEPDVRGPRSAPTTAAAGRPRRRRGRGPAARRAAGARPATRCRGCPRPA